jgi:hypothetical protein
MVYVARFRETDDGMNEDVCLVGSGCTDGEFTVGAVHGIAGLESHDAGPVEFGKMCAELGGSN